MSERDFMPLEGWDHIELWVGNAKQAAYFYEHAFGFTRVAYAGPETGIRDRATYVLEQGEIRLVLSSGLRPDSDVTRVRVRARRRRQGRRAPVSRTRGHAYREAVARGAQSVVEPHWVEDEHGRVELATIATYGENVHTFVNRTDYSGPYLRAIVSLLPNGSRSRASGCARSTTSWATSSSAG